jgi:lipopolysaccharide transport system ATP-binding protein
MSGTAVRAEGLGKMYRLAPREAYGALRDSIARAAIAPFRRLAGRSRATVGSTEVLWALRHVSFEVVHGDVVGIVGRNGSGKSTLLKMLSRITEPTEGTADVRGRVGSLLEVGTGFHPELTGRENVLVNGAILGMSRKETERRFDAIVAFADVERFIDTPVKHYSSGMQMRLAFAVAAHLEPELLLIDEVLAVGDAAFQRKCLGKMDEVHRGGRTILLVSHQMNQLRRLCTKAIWLDGGRLVKCGPAPDVIGAYEASFRSAGHDVTRRVSTNSRARFLSWRIANARSGREHIVDDTEAVTVIFRLEVTEPLTRARHGIACLSPAGQNLWATAVRDLDLSPGVYEFVHTIPGLALQPGPYSWQVSVYHENGMIDLWDCLPEMVIATRPVTHYRDEYTGLLNLPSTFECTDVLVDEPQPALSL